MKGYYGNSGADHVRSRLVRADGFTLIEVLVSLLILSLLVITLVALFTAGYVHILLGGDRSITVFELQGMVEDKTLSPKDETEDDEEWTMNLNFPGVGPVDIAGKKVTVEKSDQDHGAITLTVFLPVSD